MAANHCERSRGPIWAGFSALILALGVDFHFDVRHRDAFSWMDPYQYYEFALAVLAGSEHFTGFEVPSIFPFFLLPALSVSPSIPAALWTNFAFTLLLLPIVHGLCRELELRTPSPIVAVLVLSSPLLAGLSRTMYPEYGLSVMVALTILLWLRFSRSPDARSGVSFAIALGLGFMTKMTFPLFVALPVGAAIVERLAKGRTREAVFFLEASVMPILIVLLIQTAFFPRSFGYYLSLANTTLPIMRLIGPPDWLSWQSFVYYFGQLARTMTFLLTPFLGVAVWVTWRRAGTSASTDPTSSPMVLWLWLLGPLLLLTLQPVKEPRHVAPCAIPAVLLVVLGIEALPKRAVRAALTTAALVLAVAQFALVTGGRIEKPYFLDGPLHYAELRSQMMTSTGDGLYRRTPPELKLLHWKYNQNVAIAGFPANEALALTWQGFPGVVFDLDTFRDPTRLDDRIPYEAFEDLFFLAGVNTYNRRCGWKRYHRTLSRETVIANADFLILNDVDASESARRFPNRQHLATLDRRGGSIQLLQARGPTTPYRALYARKFLERHPSLADGEVRTVAEELLIAAVLGGDASGARGLVREFSVLRDPSVAARNIYWIGGYPALLDLTRRRIDGTPTEASR